MKVHDKWEQVTTTGPKAVGLNGEIRSYTFRGHSSCHSGEVCYFLELGNPWSYPLLCVPDLNKQQILTLANAAICFDRPSMPKDT